MVVETTECYKSISLDVLSSNSSEPRSSFDPFQTALSNEIAFARYFAAPMWIIFEMCVYAHRSERKTMRTLDSEFDVIFDDKFLSHGFDAAK